MASSFLPSSLKDLDTGSSLPPGQLAEATVPTKGVLGPVASGGRMG